MFEDRLRAVLARPWPVFELDGARLHAPSVDEVLALGECAPVDPALITQLWALDVTGLDEDQALAYAVAMDRVANAAHARRGLAAAATVAACPDSPQAPRQLRAAAQLGAALGLGSGGADELVTTATQLAGLLPATQAAALAGDLPWRKAVAVALGTLGLTRQAAGRVEDTVLPKAWGRTPGAHQGAVRRAVEQLDPERADRDRADREHDIRLVIHHHGAGMGELFAYMRSEDLDLVRLAADGYARRLKAAGDPRGLDELRVAFLPQCARSFLSHGDPGYCDSVCDPLPPHPTRDPDDPGPDDPGPGDDGGDGGWDGDSPQHPAGDPPAVDIPPDDLAPPDDAPSHDDPPPTAGPPTRHGRPLVLHLTWDLSSYLGLTSHCGLLRDSGTMLPPSAVRDLLTGGGRVRRMVIDPDTGEQLDLTPTTWALPAVDTRVHVQPVLLTLTTTARLADLPDELRAAVAADPTLTAMLDYPLTADDLDGQPDAEHPSPALAEYTASRAGHPVNPAAGPTAASAADLDHHHPRSDGGHTIRANLGPFVRRWHRLKTFADWTVHQTQHGWEWTSPTGRKYTIEPHDYRLGP